MAIKGAAHLDASTGKLVDTEINSTGLLLAANNLSDLISPSTALTNLGINGSPVTILSTTTSINGASTGTTTLYTVPGGKTAVILGAIVRITALSAFVGVGTGGIGTNVTQDNIMSSRAMTGLNAVGTFFCFMNANGASAVANATEVIQLGVDVAFVAGSATLALDLIGYLL